MLLVRGVVGVVAAHDVGIFVVDVVAVGDGVHVVYDTDCVVGVVDAVGVLY